MVILTQILDSEEIVFVDSSIQEGNNNFSESIYPLRYFNQLDLNILKIQLESLQKFKKILKHPNTQTLKPVTAELRKYNEILSTKIILMNKSEKNRFGRVKKKFNQNQNGKNQNLKKEAILSVQEEIYQIVRLSKAKEWDTKMNPKKFNSLLRMVNLISSHLRLKTDRKFELGKKDRDASDDSETDESLVAASYYSSLYSNKSSALLASDEDFGSLFGTCTKIIGCSSFLLRNGLFREKIRTNPFKFYYKGHREPEYRLRIDSSNTGNITFDTDTYHPKLKAKIYAELKTLIELNTKPKKS